MFQNSELLPTDERFLLGCSSQRWSLLPSTVQKINVSSLVSCSTSHLRCWWSLWQILPEEWNTSAARASSTETLLLATACKLHRCSHVLCCVFSLWNWTSVALVVGAGWMRTWMCAWLISASLRKSTTETTTDRGGSQRCLWNGSLSKAWPIVSTPPRVTW